MSVAKKPNIIFILTDDQGCWSLGCLGNKEIRTPHIDKLAKEGALLSNFFCVSPVCSPARASLLTGRIPSQHGVHDWIRKGNGDPARRDAPINYLEGISAYTELLAQNGYTCGISGKWHLGASSLPQKGFSHWFVTSPSNGSYHNSDFYRGSELVKTDGYVTEVITDDSLSFIETCSKEQSDKPFYLTVSYTAPHSPHVDQHPKEYVDYYYEHCTFEDVRQDPRSPWMSQSPIDIQYSLSFSSKEREYLTLRDLLSGYYAAVQAVDDSVGRIVSKLEELGIRDDTLIVYSSDNGFNCGQHGIWGKGNCTSPLNLFDTSVKVPCIFNLPGRIKQGVSSDALLSGYDFMPTLLDLAGIENPEQAELPGKSFLATLEEGEEREYHENITVFDEYGPARMIRTKDFKYIHRYPYGPHELYDLADDPEERFNLINENRYFKYGPKFIEEKSAEMKAMMDAWFAEYADPDKDGRSEPVYGRGQLMKVGAASEGKLTFYPEEQVGYER
ncbi:sulfatase-like hydrolase/transferase [Treponema sp. OttesenSCG-928-L16]|nr:sulfatase-like hydrolase/transferase [Treponema sp. OttesenSCG-928-L16]